LPESTSHSTQIFSIEPDSSALASGAHARSNTSSLCPPLRASPARAPDRLTGACTADQRPQPTSCAVLQVSSACNVRRALTATHPSSAGDQAVQACVQHCRANTRRQAAEPALQALWRARLRGMAARQPCSEWPGSAPNAAAPPSAVGRQSTSSPPSPADASTSPAQLPQGHQLSRTAASDSSRHQDARQQRGSPGRLSDAPAGEKRTQFTVFA